MWGWVVSAAVTLLGSVLVWYYRSRSVDSQVARLLTENQATLITVNSLLKALTDKANATSVKDQKDASNVKTAKEASDFLNVSGRLSHNTSASLGTGTYLHIARRAARTHFVYGFGRGPSDNE